MIKKYDAFIARESNDYARGTVRLLVWGPTGGGRASAYLRQDGTWRDVDEATTRDEDAGFLLPAEAVEAIASAIQEFQGHASHADTEARVLREWLTAERARVDQVLRNRGES
jgi:hypothetical protein